MSLSFPHPSDTKSAGGTSTLQDLTWRFWRLQNWVYTKKGCQRMPKGCQEILHVNDSMTFSKQQQVLIVGFLGRAARFCRTHMKESWVQFKPQQLHILNHRVFPGLGPRNTNLNKEDMPWALCTLNFPHNSPWTMSSRLVLHINHSPPSLAGMETAIHQKSKPTEDHGNLRGTPPMPPQEIRP